VNLGLLGCALGATCALPSTLAARAALPAAPQALAADGSFVYWTDANGDVLSLALAGGSPVLLATDNDADEGSFYPAALTAAAGRVYYVDPGSGELMTATGGTAASATTYSATSPTALATDGTSLYWADGTTISKCALGASCATPTEIYGTAAAAIAVDATNVYWIDTGSNATGIPNVWEFHK